MMKLTPCQTTYRTNQPANQPNNPTQPDPTQSNRTQTRPNYGELPTVERTIDTAASHPVLIIRTQIRGHTADSHPPSHPTAVRALPCVFISIILQPFLASSTRGTVHSAAFWVFNMGALAGFRWGRGGCLPDDRVAAAKIEPGALQKAVRLDGAQQVQQSDHHLHCFPGHLGQRAAETCEERKLRHDRLGYMKYSIFARCVWYFDRPYYGRNKPTAVN